MNSRPLDPGLWHVIRAECQSYDLVMTVDDGDGLRRNGSMSVFEWEDVPAPIRVDRIVSVFVGGTPEFTGVDFVRVRNDLRDSELLPFC